MIKFVLLVNKMGQTRLSKYYGEFLPVNARVALEGEIVRKCLARTDRQCSFMEHEDYRVVYRRYASLYFIVGVDKEEENELATLEFIHALVETLDKFFENVCELDLMFAIAKTHQIVDEMVLNGCVLDTNKRSILMPLLMAQKHAK